MRLEARLGERMKDTLTVCDREADLDEDVSYKWQHAPRFLVCAQADRRVLESTASRFETLEEESADWCGYPVRIPQRDGRSAARRSGYDAVHVCRGCRHGMRLKTMDCGSMWSWQKK